MGRVKFTSDEAAGVARALGISFDDAPFDLEQFRLLTPPVAPYGSVTG